MNINPLNNYKYHISFGVSQIPDSRNGSSLCILNPELAEQAESIISAYKDVNESLKKLQNKKNNSEAKELLKEIKKEHVNTRENCLIVKKEDKNILYSVQNDRSIWIREQDNVSKRILKSTYISDRRIAKTDTSSGIPNGIKFIDNKAELIEQENYLKEVFDDIDFSLLRLRKKVSMPVFFEKVDESLSTVYTTFPYIKRVKSKPKSSVVDKVEVSLVQGVSDGMENVRKTLHSIKAPMTRTRIKKEYPKILENNRGSKALDFKGIGPNGEDISVNMLIYEDQKLILLKIKQPDNTDKYIVSTLKGEIVKRHLNRLLHNRQSSEVNENMICQVTSKNEGENYAQYFEAVKNTLEDYNNFLTNRINKMHETKKKFSTEQVGSTKAYTKTIDSIYRKYCIYKKEIVKLNHSEKGPMIREKFHLESKQGQPSLIFRNAVNRKEHLFISFPMINNERCAKIILLDKNDEIKESFLIQGEKLVKFNAKDVHRSARNDRGFYYHTQSEIDNSSLGNYLKTIDVKLNKIMRAIDWEKPKTKHE